MAQQINHAAMAGTAMKKRKPPTGTGPKIGDRVRLVSKAPLRNDEMDLQGKTGEIIECTEGKRATVRFANGRLLMGRDVGLFGRKYVGAEVEAQMARPRLPPSTEAERHR